MSQPCQEISNRSFPSYSQMEYDPLTRSWVDTSIRTSSLAAPMINPPPPSAESKEPDRSRTWVPVDPSALQRLDLSRILLTLSPTWISFKPNDKVLAPSPYHNGRILLGRVACIDENAIYRSDYNPERPNSHLMIDFNRETGDFCGWPPASVHRDFIQRV